MTKNAATSMRAGIVGAGYISDFHLRGALRVPGVDVVAICDLSEPAAKKLAAGHAGAHVYTAYDRMLGEAKLDVVHVLTQPDSHVALAKAALEAGCHVLLEKPVADSSASAEALAEIARKCGRVVTVNHNFVFSRPFIELRKV